MRILDIASTAGDAAIAGLLEEPNQTDALLPGTNLRLVCELQGTHDATGRPDILGFDRRNV